MSEVITVSARRTFKRSFVVAVQLWFGAPSGYAATIGLAALMAYLFYDGRSPWMTGITGIAWVALMIPFVLAMQAWKITRWYHALGQPILSFDAESATLRSGDIVTRIPWSGVKRIKLTGKTCFIYITPRLAWYFARDEANRQDEKGILNFAQRANVQLVGKDTE
ncbi:MAG TPA: hypothetical protein VME63_10500 [Dyella sp.]|uniref:hypothetical protein n=1 Tax=Dyella sp. TaxID=1869338 RepID=UPI002CB2AC04|nr:hypothetical protein [Dyella sp.]HTV85830.1 hypothetical protein [Dyella sp.]